MINYNEFLLESGISKIIKEYVEIIMKNYNSGKRNFTLSLLDDRLPLSSTEFIFHKSNSYFVPLSGIDNNNLVCKFFICIKDDNLTKIQEEIIHELTHAIEFFNIVKKLKQPLNYLLKMALDETKEQFYTDFESFRYLIYLSLDKELNSRVSQVYKTLREKRSKNYDDLYGILINTYSWKRLQEIKSFNPNIITTYLIEKIGELPLIKLINEFNDNFENILELKERKILRKYNFLKKEIFNKNDVLNYFNNWKKIFEIKIKKHEKKLLKMIDVVITDIIDLENYNTKEPSPKFFNEYLKYVDKYNKKNV